MLYRLLQQFVSNVYKIFPYFLRRQKGGCSLRFYQASHLLILKKKSHLDHTPVDKMSGSEWKCFEAWTKRFEAGLSSGIGELISSLWRARHAVSQNAPAGTAGMRLKHHIWIRNFRSIHKTSCLHIPIHILLFVLQFLKCKQQVELLLEF